MSLHYRLQKESLVQEIQQQGLKHYWIADQVGVHPTTFRRWLSGKIDWVQSKHFERLAKVLAIDPARLDKDSLNVG